MSDLPLGWSSSASDSLSAANAANVDVNLFASECALSSFHTKYALSILIPLFGLGVVIGTILFLKVAVSVWGGGSGGGGGMLGGLRATRAKTLVDASIFAVAPLLYIPVARATFVLFDCTQLPNGEWVLDSDPGVACGDEKWGAVFPLGVATVFLFVLGVPAYFFASLISLRSSSSLLDPVVYARYGGLYKLFRVEAWWGGVLDLCKRLVVVALATFASEHQLVLLGGLVSIFVGWLLLVSTRKPYFFPLYNALDAYFTLVLTAILFLGAASYAERGTGEEATSKDTIFGLLVTVLIAFVLLSVGALVFEIYQIVKAKRGLYVVDEEVRAQLGGWLESRVGDLREEDRVTVSGVVSLLRRSTPNSNNINKGGGGGREVGESDEYTLMTVE